MNKKLLRSYEGTACELCGSIGTTVGHHIKTKGSGGDDLRENLIGLCHSCHMGVHSGKLTIKH